MSIVCSGGRNFFHYTSSTPFGYLFQRCF